MNLGTKARILNTAEHLFAQQGFDATSLRQIISTAAVNLAAVHYHFHSKDSLLNAVILRKVTPVNQARMDRLASYERAGGDRPPTVEQVLEAFIAPTLAVREQHPEFVQLIGRLQAEGVMTRLMQEHFSDVIARFRDAFSRALPGMPPEVLQVRIHFMIGAMAHAFRGIPEVIPGTRPLASEDLSRRLVEFLAAGFRAPVLAVREKE